MRRTACADCAATLLPGARFCTACGAETQVTAPGARARARRRRPGTGSAADSNLPWYIAGAVLLVLLFVFGAPMIVGNGDRTPDRGTATITGRGTAPGTPAPLTGTPREQADRLFNRVMAAREQNDMAEALQFAPMGIQAYQMAEPLDDDGLYHVAILQTTVSDYAAALRTAERILDRNPNHLLGLGAAAEAARGAGDTAAVRRLSERFLAAWESEIARALPEYQHHARILPEYRQAALRVTTPE